MLNFCLVAVISHWDSQRIWEMMMYQCPYNKSKSYHLDLTYKITDHYKTGINKNARDYIIFIKESYNGGELKHFKLNLKSTNLKSS